MDPAQQPNPVFVSERPSGIFSGRPAKIIGAVAVVLVVGGGAFGIAHAVTGSGTTPTSTTAPAAAPTAAVVRGVVTAVDASSVTIETATRSTTSFSVDSSTKFTSVAGTASSLAAVATGDLVSVTPSTSDKSTAASVEVVRSGVGAGAGGGGGFGRGAGGGRFANGTFGAVASVAKGSFTVTARDFQSGTTSTVTVTVSPQTTYSDSSDTSPSFADVKVGTNVAVTGKKSGSDIVATAVVILGARGGGGGFGGGGFGGGGGGGGGGRAPSGGTS